MNRREMAKEIFFIIPNLAGGGAERVFVTIINNINKKKYRPVLVVFSLDRCVYLKDVSPDIEVINLKANRVLSGLTSAIKLIRGRRPSVVISTQSHLNLALCIVRHFLRVQLICRETSILSRTIQENRLSGAWRLAYKFFYSSADLIICQSISMADDLRSTAGIEQEKLEIINNPIDIRKVRESCFSSAKAYVKQADEIILLSAGRLSREKRHDILIEAISLIRHPNLKLFIIGSGPMELALKNYVERLNLENKIIFAGFQSNPFSWYISADALVVASDYEGFPNVVIESLCCGLPVVAAPGIGGLTEIIEPIPQCVLASEHSAAALKAAISFWLDSPRIPLSGNETDKYDVKKIVEDYEAVIDRVMRV